MKDIMINTSISKHIVMTGVKYKDNHPGGISAVVQYWSAYIENLQYYPTFKEGSKLQKLLIMFSSYFCLLIRLLFDCRIKIVHIHTAAGADFKRSAMIVNLAKFFNKKVIIHSHASQFKVFYAESSDKQKKWIVEILNKADVLIALSESWREWFITLGIIPDKITILHNITAYPQITRKKENFTNRPIRFLFMGEIGQRKGIFDILRGLTNHRDEIKDKIELRIGGNKMESELRKTIDDGGLADFVKFEGWVSGEKKIELLNWADVYILPSFNEGLPISILEAMSYRMPIISSPVGGIPEVVDKSNGLLVTPGNDEEIFAAMKFYSENEKDIILQGNESYRKAEAYLPDYVLNHLKNIYNQLLKQYE